MKLLSLQDLFIKELRDLYDAERQLNKALPRIAKAATSAALQRALHDHLAVTDKHIERLDDVFATLDLSGRGARCEAMKSLVEEAEELTQTEAGPAVRDAGLICMVQRMKHYEMAGYGCARTFARFLQRDQAAHLLQLSLDEEGDADKELTQLAESEVNTQASVGSYHS